MFTLFFYVLIADEFKNRNTSTYRGCLAMGKTEIVWCGKTDSGREFHTSMTLGIKDLEK